MTSCTFGKLRAGGASLVIIGSFLLAGTANAYSAFAPDSPYMFGDWGGERTALEDAGVAFSFDYVGEAASILDGGYRDSHVTKYADQFAVGANVDLDKLAGIPDAEFQVTMVNRNGHTANDRLSDPDATIGGSNVQEVQGRGPVTRLTQFWYRQGFFDDALSIKLGRIPFGDDFATIDSNFQNLAFGGAQPGNWGNNIYNWPISQWAAVIRTNFASDWYAQLGAFNINDSNLENDNGFDLRTSGTEGTLFPVELGYTPTLNGMDGAYKLGFYTQNVENRAYGAGPATDTSDTNTGLYYVVQQQVTTRGGNPDRGLTLFSMGNANHGDTAGIDRYLSIGATYEGPFDARPQDDAGIGLAYLHVNDDVNDYVDYYNATPAGLSSPLPRQGHEYDAEIYYSFNLTDYLALRPNLQYVVNPSAVDSVDNAWVAGTTIKASF
ncbi:carbohydrate porin [Chromohalobacter nigrandesensis]|uniref:carbohydrate porin n=1 Tax=Chromohalobacter nigrandesensis TaxID=119863 RepID=UPI001FF19303|nr:carbohydrate porin [Chromohalobacter nigrandesensis]MCK0746090.1 carbohydrate porin [Chromohalobacter nigrandesensis]